MILQALGRYYDALAARGAVRPPGWCDAPVSFALSIDQNGALQGVIPVSYTHLDVYKRQAQSQSRGRRFFRTFCNQTFPQHSLYRHHPHEA